MIKLDTTMKLYTPLLQPYPHKNFSAVIFFNFFWKGQKIIRFPVPYNLSPWGLTDGFRESDEQSFLAREKKYPEVYYYEVKNVQFYITIQVGILQGYPLDYHFKCWFINFFGRDQYFDEEEGLPKEVLIKKCIEAGEDPSNLVFESGGEGFHELASVLKILAKDSKAEYALYLVSSAFSQETKKTFHKPSLEQKPLVGLEAPSTSNAVQTLKEQAIEVITNS